MSKKSDIKVGDAVSVKGHGAGVVELIHSQEDANGAFPVFHVRLENGEVRHFTAEQLKSDE